MKAGLPISVRICCALAAAIGAAAAGCDMLGTDEERSEQAAALAECRGDATDAEVLENILISEEYALGVAADLTYSWEPVLFALDFVLLWGQTLGAVPSTEPVGWTFEDGVYRYGSDTAAIEMRVYLSEAIGYGPAGAPVTEDVLDLESYLVGAAVTPGADAGTAVVAFDAPGPLVELLGFGPAPASPLVIDAAARDAAVAGLSTLALAAEYVAYGVTQSTVVDYHAVSPATPIAVIAADGLLPVEIVAVNASREALGQTLSTVTWDAARHGVDVSGSTTFTVSGGHFPYGGRLEFEDVAGIVFADRELYCL